MRRRPVSPTALLVAGTLLVAAPGEAEQAPDPAPDGSPDRALERPSGEMAAIEDLLARAEEAWRRRGEGRAGGRAAPEPIGAAVAALEAAIELDPGHLEARGRLMRALYFQAEYTLDDPAEKLETFRRARDFGEAGLDLLARRAGGSERLDGMEPAAAAAALADEPEARWITFWTAAHWGLWGRETGKLKAARMGVARKVRDYALITIHLDERFQNAGGHRVLGRLHTEAPRIPLITGWVDRETAVRELERAVELAPDDLLSRLYLIEALLEHRPDRRPEARERLRDLLASAPDPEWIVEEEAVLRDARALAERISLRTGTR